VSVPQPEEEYLAIEAMQRYGGGFVAALGAAWVKADAQNRARLRAAFPAVLQEYHEIARQRREREREREAAR
jgi:hypothetical protein